MSILKWFKSNKPTYPQASHRNAAQESAVEKEQDAAINGNMEDALRYINRVLGENDDFLVRRFHVFGQYKAVMLYFSNMINQNTVNTDILKPLMHLPVHLEHKSIEMDQLKDVLINDTMYHSEGKLESNLSKLVNGLVRGKQSSLSTAWTKPCLSEHAILTKDPSISRRQKWLFADLAKGLLSSWERISLLFATDCNRLIFECIRWKSGKERDPRSQYAS